MVVGKLDIYMQKKETGPNFIPYAYIYLKWIKFFNIELKTLNLLEEIKEKNLTDLDTGKILKNMIPKAQATKQKIEKIKLKSLCTAKETINDMKRQTRECDKIFASHIR